MIRRMNPIAYSCLAVGLVLTACGGSDPAAETDPTTTTSPVTTTTVAEATTTTEGPTLSWAPPVTAELSRDARTALVRCYDKIGYFFVEWVLDDPRYLKDTIDLCDEAALQVKVDGGHADIDLIVADLNLALAFANLAIVSGQFDAEEQATMQTAATTFRFKLDAELD